MSDRQVSEQVEQALDVMGLKSAHEFALQEIPPYAHKMEEFIKAGLRKPPEPKQKINPLAGVREFLRQLRFGFLDERIESAHTEELIQNLERFWAALDLPPFIIEDGLKHSLREIVETANLSLFEVVIARTAELTAITSEKANIANSCVKICDQLYKRLKKSGKLR